MNNRHITKVVDSKKYFYGVNNVGSTVLLTDETGNAVWNGDITPYGDKQDTTGEITEDVKYTGKHLDSDTGLYYFNARWYDSNLGRFINEDPIKHGSNWYVYASNNPLRFIDPTGLSDEDFWDADVSESDIQAEMDNRFELSLEDNSNASFESLSEEEYEAATDASGIGKVPLLNDFVEGGYFFYQNKIKGQGWDDYQFSPISNNLVSPKDQKDKAFMTFMDVTSIAMGASAMRHTYGSVGRGFQALGQNLKNIPKNISSIFKKPVSNPGASNRALFKKYTDGLIKTMDKPAVKDNKLGSLLDDLYRKGATTGNGSTAAAVRHELATGNKVGGKLHSQKAQDYATALESWISKHPTALPGDRAAAENVLSDLLSAIGGN